MIPFDYKLWKTGKYKPITKSGQEVKIAGIIEEETAENSCSDVLGWMDCESKDGKRKWYAVNWRIDGRFNFQNTTKIDLMLVEKKKTYNVIVYASGDKIILSTPRPIFVKSELFEYYESVDEEEKRLRLTYKNLRYLKIIEIEI